MSPPSGNPSWIERGWSIWIRAVLRLPRTVLLATALVTAAGGAYVLAGHPAVATAFAVLGLPGLSPEAPPEPAFEREIVLRARLRDGYESAELIDAAHEAARCLARERELFNDVEIRFAAPASSGELSEDGVPAPQALGNVSADAIRRAEDRLAFWQALPVNADGSVSPADLWRTLARQGETSPMHALEADGLIFAAAQRVSRGDDGASDPAATARLTETFDTFWSLSAAIAPDAREVRVFARLAPAAARDVRLGRLASTALSEGLDGVRMRWPSVGWTISGPGYARVTEATAPSGPNWWDLATLLAAGALAASAAGDLRRFGAAASAAIVSGAAAYALAWSADPGGLISPAALSLALTVWTALVATLILSSLASAFDIDGSLPRALTATLSGAGTAALVPLAIATIVYGVAAAGDVPGAAPLFRVVAAWSLFSLVLWTAFFPATLATIGRFGSRNRAAACRRPLRRPASSGVAAPIGALTVAATLFLAWGAVHLRNGSEEGVSAEGSRAAGVADRRFALFLASSPEELSLARSRFAALEAVDATAAGSDGRTDSGSPQGARLLRIAAAAKTLPASTPLTARPDWPAFTDALRNETSENSPASTSQRRRLAQATLERTARMRPADVDRALGRCFEAWLLRRDREIAALAAFGAQTASLSGAGAAGAREADRFFAADGSPLLWIFPKPGVDPTEFVAALRGTGAEVGGPAVAAANRSSQRRQLAMQTSIFVVGAAAAVLMIVLQSLRDVTSVLWAGGCSLAQTVGISGWLGIPWHEEWVASAPLAAAAWMASALTHRLAASRGEGDLWTGAPFATLAASVAAMAVALRWIGAGDEAGAAAASWWAVALAAGWWNGWAYCSRDASRDQIEQDEADEEEPTLDGRFALVDAPTHVLARARTRRASEADPQREMALPNPASFAYDDETTESLPFSAVQERRRAEVVLPQEAPRADRTEATPVSRRRIERLDANGVVEPREHASRGERHATAVLPRRRAVSREEPERPASADDDAWS